MESFINHTLKKYQSYATPLLMILREVQAQYFHIPKLAVDLISQQLGVPRTQIIAVVEFYSFLSFESRGHYDILLSNSITDIMLGKQDLADYLCQKLHTPLGTVRADRLVSIDNTSCTGLCDQGPAALVNGHAIAYLTPERIDRMVAAIKHNIPVTDWDSDLLAVDDNIHQAGLLLTAELAHGAALQAALQRGLTETLDEIKTAGLRGRGGAGFTTAMKWQLCRNTEASQRYVVCNADEGEPGTFKDRVLLNSYAHELIEGMTLCGAIIGATQGFIYLRGEYLHLYEPLLAVLAQRRNAGLLGDNILDQGLSFDIAIQLGLGAYICGEESALIESLEGKRGIPRNRPPYPVTSGYLNKPTVVNNVETFVAAAHIALHGGAWFAAHGTEQSTGTKILSISGDCAKAGIYEYPFGTSIRQILNDCGADDVLGVQVGGPSGTFICDTEFDRVLGFQDLATGGSFIIFNTSRSIFDIVQNFTDFFAHESCGFCTPCRVGTSLLKKQFDKICTGHGSSGDVRELQEIAQLIKTTSHCGLGQTAAQPIITTLERYPELYNQKIKQISFEPGFDLDGALAIARQLSGRDDSNAHLAQVEEE
ncbi:MAG: NAD(P)H-dependent oxidoreductase subunit E [Methylococcales bacterium]|nr:NAD(P)H-dependent oxidoreductase subunit E [Methylococcales bacterium]